MTRRLEYFSRLLGVGLLIMGCVEPYNPSVLQEDLKILVVEAFVDGSTNSVNVILQRSTVINKDKELTFETGANVLIERNDGAMFSLAEESPGVYQASGLLLSVGESYRLVFTLSNENQYRSEYTVLKDVAEIGNVYWEIDDDGLQLLVDTDGLSDSDRFYRWTFTETYEYHSQYTAVVSLVNGQFQPIPEGERSNFCWRNRNSIGIQIYSTTELTENKVRRNEFHYIPKGDIRLSQRYSILVKQHALSREGYTYWKNTKNSNENLGGLFDPIPSQVIGNIYNVNDENEPVIGFFDGCFVKEKRIFIDYSELSSEFYYGEEGCSVVPVYFPTPGVPYGSESFVISTFTEGNSTAVAGYFTAERRCVDCRMKGGVNIKPEFW